MEVKECKKYYYRSTRYGALTRTIVIVDGNVVRGRSERSRSGSHGEDIYCLTPEQWQRAVVVTFEQSNSGKRHLFIENVSVEIAKIAEQLWIYEGTSMRDIINAVIALSKKQ